MKAQRPATANVRTRPTATSAPAPQPRRASATELFGKENLKWMAIGVALLILGFVLMAGGGSPDPNVFNKDEVYSTRRITVAPFIILLGLVVEIYAIFRQPKPSPVAP